MANKKSTNAKNKLITLRVTAEEDRILNGVAESLHLAKSDLIRNATHRYLTMRPGDPIRKMVVEKEILRRLFERATPDMIQEFARIEVEYGLKDDEIDRILNPELGHLHPVQAFVYHMTMNVNYVLTTAGQNWFEKIDMDNSHGRLKIMCTHGLGMNFSHFLSQLFQGYAQHFGVSLSNEALQEDAILLTFEIPTIPSQKTSP